MYYAEATGFSITEDIYEGEMLLYEKDTEPYCDLFRFDTKKQRDIFVEESASHSKISAQDARRYHKDQFNYWAKH